MSAVVVVTALAVAGQLVVRSTDDVPLRAEVATPSPFASAAPELPVVDGVPRQLRPDRAPKLAELVEVPPARSTLRKPLVVPEQASGTFRTAPGSTDVSTAVTTYEVAVENGQPIKVRDFAQAVTSTLEDRRSWQAAGDQFQRATTDGDFRVVLASPRTADQLCAPLNTGGRLSCRNGRDVVINAWRWANGAESYAGNLRRYRHYVVNHEVGHALGYGHRDCPSPGALAPVMVQQTKGLQGCKANPWPAVVDLQ